MKLKRSILSPIITCKSISKTFGSQPLFENLSISFSQGCRSGIIGPNGTGKSTLLKLIAGIEQIDEGEIARNRGLRVGYVPQIRQFDETDTVQGILKKSAMGSQQDEITAETNVAVTCSLLGFEDPSVSASSLSGGWQKRLTIAEQLIREPDLLLLDEPTNHLDYDGLRWLEDLLSQANFSWVLITHDRYFLDKLARETVEINPCYPDGYMRSEGGYTSHVKQKDFYFDALESQEQSLSSKVRRETEWLQRGPKARTTKARFRIDQAHQLKKDLGELRKLKKKDSINIDFSSSNRKTKSLIQISESDIGYDESLYQDFSIEVMKGQRIGILGPNGSGKTTIIRSLIGTLPLISGKRKEAKDLSIVYFSQARDELNEEHTLKRALGDGNDQVIFRDRPVHIISWARRFGFQTEDLNTPLKDLSGGQLARVHIALLMLKKADILFLDEPTNDLDLETIEVVENSLSSFPGSIIMVSHDRRFLENLCHKFIGLFPRKKYEIISSYSQWEKSMNNPQSFKKSESGKKTQSQKEQNSDSTPAAAKKVKLTYKDQFELDNMEASIQKAEANLEKLTQEVENLSMANKVSELQEASSEMEEAQAEVDRLYARWDELESKQNGLS